MKMHLHWLSLGMAILFFWLFYEKALGLNLALFSLLVVFISLAQRKDHRKSNVYYLSIAVLVSLSIATAWHGEIWTIMLLLGALFLHIGILNLPEVIWPTILFQQSMMGLPNAQTGFARSMATIQPGRRRTGIARGVLIYIVPAALVLLFVALYSGSNPIFHDYLQRFLVKLSFITDYISFKPIFIFILGLLIVNLYLFISPNTALQDKWSDAVFYLTRRGALKGRKQSGLSQYLKYEYKAAVFLALTLNVLLFFLNIADIQVVWIGFQWNGQLLKDFVHEGTWFLILSMLLSLTVVLFFFRGKLHFFSKIPFLRNAVYVWLVQNAFLAISVLLRNWHYVEYYGLAFKRIGVFFFVAAILGAVVLVWIKVARRETFQNWFNKSLIMGMTLMALSGIFDWSVIITRYNLKHYHHSFVHIEFLMDMPDHAILEFLPYAGDFDKMERVQQKLGFGYRGKYKNKPVAEAVQDRLMQYKLKLDKKSWQEWSYADQKAANSLAFAGVKPHSEDNP